MSKSYINIIKTVIVFVFVSICTVFTVQADTKYTIVIDAGHGGKDAGAVDNGVKEKDINLSVALQLGEMIKKKLKNVKVVYTRDKDTYLTLQQRADKANKVKGDLFISIHVNSVDKKNKNRRTVAGASVYTLGLHRDHDNMEVARRENAVISLETNYETKYQGFDPDSDESYIIFEMAQKDNLNQSIIIANEIQQQLVKEAGRKDRGVHQAGFWVLWATSMPSVLVELDFICNPNSAKYIASTTGQKKLAQGIFNAVKSYFTQLEKGAFNEPENVEPAATEDSFYADAVIATPDSRRTKVAVAPATPARNNGQNKRRRRSETSRRASANREIEVAVISVSPEVEETVVIEEDAIENDDTATRSETDAPNTQNPPIVNNQNMGGGEDAVDVVDSSDVAETNETSPMVESDAVVADSGDTEVVTVTNNQPVQTDIKKKKKRRSSARLNSYYTIVLFESTDHLFENDPRFAGLDSIKITENENGEYLYICGEYENKSEVTEIYNKVVNRFPEATIVKMSKGTNKIIN